MPGRTLPHAPVPGSSPPRGEWGCFAGVALAAVLAGLMASCACIERTVMMPPAVEGANFVGNKVCHDCHTNISRVFPSSPHARLHFEGVRLSEATGCEGCHGPGSKHVEAGGGRGRFIVNPGRDARACLECHLETHAQFTLPQHHPVPEGRMNCVQCHDPHGQDIMKPSRGLAMARLNESCAGCHREQARPFVFEHEAMREGCVACHQPHGSINSKLLNERDNNLCLRCHAQRGSAGRLFIGQVDHTERVRLGGCWSAGCHTAVHGSNVHPRQLY
jgi:predicted CXXCH cytochrome family protein